MPFLRPLMEDDMKPIGVHFALSALLLLMVRAAVGGVDFEERFAGDANGDGVADGLELVGNPNITLACSLDAGLKADARSQKLHVTASAVSEQVGVATRPFAIKAGQDYRVTLSYRTEGLEDAEVFAFLGWYDEARARHERFDLVKCGRSDEWKTVSLFFKPESSGWASFHLRLWVLKAGGRGKAWFDGLSVESAEEPKAVREATSFLVQTKLIKCGWDTNGLTPGFVRANIRRMERQPFDGIMFRLDERFTNAFDTRPWPEAEVQAVIDKDLSRIEWGSFTDNFITLHCANHDGMDWFNDAHWTAIAGNLRLAGRAVKAGRLKGIVFDTEPYGVSPWEYRLHASRPFAQVAAKVRQRGAQFIQALQQEKPDVRLFCYWLLSYWACYQPDLLDEADPTRVDRLLSQDAYGLMAPFAAGLLDGLGAEAVLVDGNEAAYYYKNEHDYLRGYFLLKARAQNLLAPEIRDKYRRQTQVAQAIWHAWTDGSGTDVDTPGRYLTPEERAGLLEWKVWQSLRVTDEYAWYYTDLSE